MKHIQHHRNPPGNTGNLRYHVKISGIGKPLICLHGFSEDHTTWRHISIPGYALYQIDLVGHGQSDKPEEKEYYTLEAVLGQLHTVIHQVIKENYSMMGYSMGGRIALAYALEYQEEMDRLVLESAGIGIGDRQERLERRRSDQVLAENIVKNGISWFQEYWSGLEIFDTQGKLPTWVREEIKQRRLHNSERALANTLLGVGQGMFPYYGEKLCRLPLQVLYISGALDEKFSKIGEDIAKRSQNVTFHSADHAGHNVHLEQPDCFRRFLIEFLN